MSKPECYICSKSSKTGNKVSHSNRKSRRTWQANLQRAKIKVEGTVKTVRVCTRCIKSNKIQKA